MASVESSVGGLGLGTWPIALVLFGLIGGATATRLQVVPTERDTVQADVGETDLPALSVAPRPFQAAELLENLIIVPSEQRVVGDPCAGRDVAALVCSAERRNIAIDFMIAMVPDYVDSNIGWTFDATVNAIQSAASAAGYSLFRYSLPDEAGTTRERNASRRGRRHEQEPGLILFSRAEAPSETSASLARSTFMAVLVVTETPTEGIHDRAFLKGANFVLQWQAALAARRARPSPGQGSTADESAPARSLAPSATLRILGPNYSGSAPSLRRALETLIDGTTTPPARVRIVSGSATSEANPAHLEFDRGPTSVSFSATVRTDSQMLRALCEHLKKMGNEFGRVALLVESNTGWGQEVARGDGFGESCANPFEEAVRFQFPLHISSLRDAASNASQTEGQVWRSLDRSDLEQAEGVTDQLPSLSPQLTSATSEIMLSSILDTIRREDFDAVGILATDKRDHLFLIERLVRVVPNVLLFSTEADLIYLHPEFRSFTRGAVVASTYPLHNPTQTITNPRLAEQARYNFPTQASQGVHNAMSALLGQTPHMVDYSAPGDLGWTPGYLRTAVQPPVWISVVGQDHFWPLDVSRLDASSGYTLRVPASLLRGPVPRSGVVGHREWLLVPVWATAAAFALIVVFVVHFSAYVMTFRPPAWAERLRHTPVVRILHLHAWPASRASVAVEHRFFLLLTLVLMWLAVLFVIRLSGARQLPDAAAGASVLTTAGGTVADWMFLVGYVTLGVFVAISALNTLRSRMPPLRMDYVRSVSFDNVRGWFLASASTIVVIVLWVGAAEHFRQFLSEEVWETPWLAAIMFARTVSPGNWVSPLSPAALLGLTLYLWLVWNLRQLAMGAGKYRADSQVFRIMTGRDRTLADNLKTVLTSPWRSAHGGTVLIPLGAFLAYWLYVPTWYTPDGDSYGRFLWWASLLAVFVTAHVLAQTLHLWLLLTQLLRELGEHPLGQSFKKIPSLGLKWSLSLTPPRLGHLKNITRQTRRLSHLMDRLRLEAPAVETPGRPDFVVDTRRRRGGTAEVTEDDIRMSRALGTRAEDIHGLSDQISGRHGGLEEELRTESGRQISFLESNAWADLSLLTDALVRILRHARWLRQTSSLSETARNWYRQAELVVALQTAFVLRDILSRVVSGMTVVIIASMLILSSHLFYAWPGRAAMLAVDWGSLAVAVTVIAVMLLMLERDAILSRLWSTAENRVSFTGGFFYRIAAYGALPILTLFAWQFPEVGGSVLSWLEPLRNAIP